MYARALLARMHVKPAPLSLTYEITWLCNLSCRYCDRNRRLPAELTREQIFAALAELHRLGMRMTHLDGGDPLTHRHIDEVVEWLTGRGITVTMHTNGILVPGKLDVVRRLDRVKISLDGLRSNHDAMRGAGSFDRAIAGARAAQDAGVAVEFTCTVGRHNAGAVEPLLALGEEMGIPVVFQPAQNSLFLDTARDGSAWQLERDEVRAVFARIEAQKRCGRAVGNAWSSLRHFRSFPDETRPPCAAGWVIATMDPEGVLFPCGQVNRRDRSNSVVRLGAATAVANLRRTGCGQCWCARLVEGNYRWGLRVDYLLPPRTARRLSA
jgi:MoaA/NifB/PqqE/SkfB family radical SAM enzyme